MRLNNKTNVVHQLCCLDCETTLGRIHKNEGHPSKHKVEVKGSALKQKIEA